MRKISTALLCVVTTLALSVTGYLINKGPEIEYVEVVEKQYIPSVMECGLELSYLGEFEYTGYDSCVACCGQYAKNRPVVNGKEIVYTASGEIASNLTVAVDPNVIPLGSLLYLEGYGVRIAQDTGSAVKGNVIDIYFDNHEDAWNVGRQKGRKVWIIK
jgi:3D (Asp-Asp-Asp) domain-containing protein